MPSASVMRARDRRRTGRRLRDRRTRGDAVAARTRRARAAARTEAAAGWTIARRRGTQRRRLSGRPRPGARLVARTDRRPGGLIRGTGNAARAHHHRAAGNLRGRAGRRQAGRTRYRDTDRSAGQRRTRRRRRAGAARGGWLGGSGRGRGRCARCTRLRRSRTGQTRRRGGAGTALGLRRRGIFDGAAGASAARCGPPGHGNARRREVRRN